MKMLLKVKKNEKNVNAFDDNGMAPLHYAARYNQLDCIRYLVEKVSSVGKQRQKNTNFASCKFLYDNRALYMHIRAATDLVDPDLLTNRIQNSRFGIRIRYVC